MESKTHDITISIKESHLQSYTDEFLATAWIVAQANPAPYGDREAGELAERIGREIIRRWLSNQKPDLWRHQGTHWQSKILSDNGTWKDGEWTPTGKQEEAKS